MQLRRVAPNMRNHPPKASYRPDIDGLRAVAVLSVIIYHLNSAWLPGGFIGVDIFFVISGYLITSILHREMTEQRFSFAQFYTRRIKRILPVFFAVVMVTSLVGAVLLLPDDLIYFSKSALSTLLFASNVYFYMDRDYFAPESEELPLLHTWSLAVEEQYYMLWPVLLLLLHYLASSRGRRLGFCLCLTAVSFLVAEYLARLPDYANFSYYLLPTRAGELLIGSALALYGRDKFDLDRHGLLSTAGALLILGSLLLLTSESTFPGINAFWPCLGTAMIIFAGSGNSQHTVIYRVLSSRGMVYIGLISYSLYLWHWPILAYARYSTMETSFSILTSLLMVAAMFALSHTSWRFIEVPVRKQQMSFWRASCAYYAVPSLLLGSLVTGYVVMQGQLFHKTDLNLTTYHGGEAICHNQTLPNCVRGDTDVLASSILVGDSHTAHLNLFMEQLGRKQGWSVDIRSASLCAPLAGLEADANSSRRQRERCEQLRHELYQSLHAFDTVLVSLRWDVHFQLSPHSSYQPHPAFEARLARELTALAEQGKRIILIGQVPKYKKNVLRINPLLGIDNELDDSFVLANTKLHQLSQLHPNLFFWDLGAIETNWQQGYDLQGTPMYRDAHHLNVHGAHALSRFAIADRSQLWIQSLLR